MEKECPLITIIVPIYNVENYLKKCLDSIINQTYTNLEIILVDDGSTDKSGQICDEYAKLDKRIIVIHKENGGISTVRNMALDIAKGVYVGYVDGDDYIDKNMYSTLYKRMMNDGSEIAICGRYEVINDIPKIGLCPKKDEVIGPIETMNRLFHWDGLDSATWDKLCKKSLYGSIRFPVGKTNQDVGTMYKIILKANKISLIAKPLVYWVQRYESITHTINIKNVFHFEERTNEILSYVANYYPQLIEGAKEFRKSSLIYTISYITRLKTKDYKKCKRKLYSYKKELRDYKKTMDFTKMEKYIYYRYIFRLLRLSYYKHLLIK